MSNFFFNHLVYSGKYDDLSLQKLPDYTPSDFD